MTLILNRIEKAKCKPNWTIFREVQDDNVLFFTVTFVNVINFNVLFTKINTVTNTTVEVER